jgi:hypothetical protein
VVLGISRRPPASTARIASRDGIRVLPPNPVVFN